MWEGMTLPHVYYTGVTNMNVDRRTAYVPFSTDPNVRRRIMNKLDRDREIPIEICDEYPRRGEQIAKKTKCFIAAACSNPILVEKSPITVPQVFDDTLCVLCTFGCNPLRLEACRTAIKLLTEMNPVPQIALVEGSTDGEWRYADFNNVSGITYIPVDLTNDMFRNFFIKESLWNLGANLMLDRDEGIKYIVFMDADTFFVDRMGWVDIRESFAQYDVISPFMQCYYTGKSEEAMKYKMLNSIGHNCCKHLVGIGYQGFGLGVTREAYRYYFKNEIPNPSLGLGDTLTWFMLTGNDKMKNFRMLPYEKKECVPFIIKEKVNIGATMQVLGHVDHGPMNNRSYQARAQLMKMAVRSPLNETRRASGNKYIIGWANNDCANDLRYCFERMLIENRRELKILTYRDAEEFYLWLHGERQMPPQCMMPCKTVASRNHMPNWQCSIPVPDKNTLI